jgi:protocatechuate 3,4-dioxygenase beta subunit
MRGKLLLLVALLLPSTAAAAGAVPVCGTAAAADGSPLPAGRAELLPMERAYVWELDLLTGGDGPEPVAASDLSHGRYCLAAPGSGLFRVVVRAPGLVPMVRFPVALTGPLELPPVRLTPDEGLSVTVARVAQGPSPAVSGTAWVIATPAHRGYWAGRAGDGWRPELRFAAVDADGRARLPRGPGEALDLRLVTAGATLVARTRTGDSTTAARLDAAGLGVIRTVEVVDERGGPLAGVTVSLAEHGWPVAVTGGDGRVTLTTEPTEALSLLLEAEDGRRRVVSLPASNPTPGSAPATDPLRIELPPTPAVRGRVLAGGSRAPLPGALVWLAPDAGTRAVTGPDGGFALPGGGREQVRTEAAAPAHLSRAVVARGAELVTGRPLEILLQPGGSATGRAVDAEGGPLSTVTLEAFPEATDGSRSEPETAATSLARTGTDGRFRLPGLRAGVPYRIVASGDGLAGRTLPGVVVPPRERAVDLGDLVLRPGVRLAGRVVGPRGRPIDGAEVRVRPSAGLPNPVVEERLRERPPDAVAGANGRFELPGLATGRPLDLFTTGPGHLPGWTLGVEVSASETADPVTVVLAEASRLSGTVVDAEGVPVPEVGVELHWRGPPTGRVGLEPLRPRSRSTEAGGRGEFAFEELPPGHVILSAHPDGFLPGESDPVTLPEGDEVAGVRLVLQRGARVTGRVFDPAGEPLEGTQLRIDTATAISGADGAFRLDGVPRGDRSLHAYHPDYRAQVRIVRVEPGENAVDLYLEEGWSLSGRTVDEEGRPVAGARLELRPDRPDGVGGYRAAGGDDGSFRIVVSQEGSYRLSATHPDFAPGELGGLEIGPSPLENIEVTLTRGGSVVGRILGLAPDELAGVRVEAQREDGVGDRTAVAGGVGPEGDYAVHHLSAGSWRVRADLEGGRRQAAATVILDPGVGEAIRDLEFGSGLRLSGRVLHRGDPIAGAHVHLLGLTASGERSVLTGHDGSFRIDDLAPGRYRLDVLDRHRALSQVQDLDLSADRELRLELESEALTGTVTDADSGEPLEEATVTVRKAVGTAGELGPMIEMPTDAAGRFVVAHVTPGDYVVAARKSGYAPADRTVRMAEGAAAPVVLRLAPTGGVTLTVHLAAGGVPRMATVSAFDPSGRLVVHDTRVVSGRGFVYYDQIPAGTWDLLVSAPGTAPTWVRAEVPDSRPQVVLPPAAPLSVRVPVLVETDAAGTLTVVSESGQPFFQVDPAGEIRTRWTLSGGLITLADVPAGTWLMRVDGAQGGTWTGAVATDGRSPVQVTLE